VEVSGNSEEIKKAIRELNLRDKLKAVALNHYLVKKKKLD
jgi:sulfur carrier protein ThiS